MAILTWPTICKYCSGAFVSQQELDKHQQTCSMNYSGHAILPGPGIIYNYTVTDDASCKISFPSSNSRTIAAVLFGYKLRQRKPMLNEDEIKQETLKWLEEKNET